MGLKWKTFLVPGISGALLGFAAMLARRTGRRHRSPEFLDLSDNRKGIIIISKEQSRSYRGEEYLSQMI